MNPGDPLSKILFDNTSGSSAILSRFISFLTNDSTEDDWKKRAEKVIEFGSSELNQFQVVKHFLESLKFHFPQFKSLSDLHSWIQEYENEWASLPEKWTNTLTEMLQGTDFKISTHSQSESLKAVFYKLSKSKFKLKIFQSQSGPVNEGKLQANWLVHKGIEVSLITDSVAPGFVKKSDLVLLGCDGVYSDGFVNKAGSLALCLAAAEYRKPVYILADTRKISHDPAPREKPKPSTEISTRTHPNLEILNYYFETVPHHLVTGYITEKGILEENKKPPSENK
jgi:translation initiation factor 2B subunit (eIF-2B alpha/beta/delta family)